MNPPNVDLAMRTLAELTVSSAPLADADLIWRRAAIRARRRQAELALRPIRLAEWAACIACGAAGVTALCLLYPAVLGLAGMAFATAAGAALALVKTLAPNQ